MAIEENGTCCLCGLPYERIGNNPAPLAKGRCCDACNEIVIEARMFPKQIDAEIKRVAKTLELMDDVCHFEELALAAICAVRGPVLWAQKQRELELMRTQLLGKERRDNQTWSGLTEEGNDRLLRDIEGKDL